MTKTLKGALLAATLALGAVTQAQAAIITETYSAPPLQYVGEGDSFYFVFDFLQPNADDVFFTNSNLRLSQDAVVPFGTTFQSVSLTLGLSSTDLARETTRVNVFALDFFGTDVTHSETYTFTWNGWFGNPYQTQTFDLTDAFTSAFNDSLYSRVVIRATRDFWYNNDFSIHSVSLSANTAAVPEPATLALLGLGLVGVGAVARRRSKR